MKEIKRAYFIGIKGVGMTALAIFLKQAGVEVTGSDTPEVFVTDKLLIDENIEYNSEFNPDNLKKEKYDLVVASAAYDQTNPEIMEAKKRHLNLKYYSEVLGEISADKKVIAVAGIHGKTTITSMLAYILEKAGLNPNYIIGSGEVPNLKLSAQKGDGDYFVLEADEYRKSPEDNTSKFLDLNPEIVIITSIELDHPDIFPTIESIYDTFYRLACRVPRSGFIVLCTDYPKARKLAQTIADRDFETYGFDDTAKWKIVNYQKDKDGSTFSLKKGNETYGPFQLKLIGEHNILNATAAIITALRLEIPEKTIKKYINQFKNVKRRLETIVEMNNITILDDYAHHPTSIRSTLKAIKNNYPGSKVWCVFQPHTYSRTEKLLGEFAESFRFADKVIITDIFASAREQQGNITAVNLVDEIKKYQSNVKYIKEQSKIEDYLLDSVKSPAIIVTMGAGDIYKLANELKRRFKEQNTK
jgi:UDP-N-acetylmuramate--alanine ligase